MRIADALIMLASDMCIAGAAIGCLYIVFACVLVIRFRPDKPDSKAGPTAVPVTLFVPLCGAEPGLEDRLLRFCDQDYAAAVQILCGLQDRNDPAAQAASRVIAARPDRVIDLCVDDRVHGRNRKISNFVNMMKHARHDVLVLVDSDIEVGPSYLSKVVPLLGQPRVGVVTCLYYGIPESGLWARLAAMGINFYFLPNVILALNFNLASPCFGATIAISRHTLQRIGGFRAFADRLWDDYAIGEAVRALGYQVIVSNLVLGHVCWDRSFKNFVNNQLRYARTIRSIDPIGYAGGVITHPLPLALISVLMGDHGDAVQMACVALICRLVLCACVKYRFSIRSAGVWLIGFRDALSFAIYVTSFFGRTVVWRGRRFSITPHGTIASAK